MTEVQSSDGIKNLVLIIAGLAILGTLIALAWYFALVFPVQQALLTAPANC